MVANQMHLFVSFSYLNPMTSFVFFFFIEQCPALLIQWICLPLLQPSEGNVLCTCGLHSKGKESLWHTLVHDMILKYMVMSHKIHKEINPKKQASLFSILCIIIYLFNREIF